MSRISDLSDNELLAELAKRTKANESEITSDLFLMPTECQNELKSANSWHFLTKKVKQDLLDIAMKHLQLLDQ